MPEFVVRRIGDILNGDRKSLSGSTVYLLGVAYKRTSTITANRRC